MPLTLPNLDDRTYADLTREGRRLIPAYAPQWTNHNPSDPGITLIELFAYLTETLLYRVNRVTDENVRAFLRLLNGPDWQQRGSLDEEVRKAVQDLRRSHRAVTAADFEALALEASPAVARARCVPRRNLEQAHGIDKPGHVSVIIVPAEGTSPPQPTADLMQLVADFLEGRRLLTTRVHVVGPRYVKVNIRVTLFLKPDGKDAEVRAGTATALQEFLDPLRGGADGQGWPFGRHVYTSEIYQLLDRLPGVDYVQRSTDAHGNPVPELASDPLDPGRLRFNASGGLEALQVHPDELVDPKTTAADFDTVSPVPS